MQKQDLEEFAYKAIVELIQKNHFKPGDSLLETRLADMLGMKSRTPVRHALGQLVAKGFLEKKKKKGCFIPPASPEDARQVFFARETIERGAARCAALNATKKDIEKLRAIVEKEPDTGQSGRKYDYSNLNEDFHGTICAIGRNEYLKRYSEHIFWRSNVYIFLFGGYYTQKDFVRHMLSPPQHLKIVEAIENRDADSAGELMAEHVRFTFDHIFDLI